jgi:hypothetical protein
MIETNMANLGFPLVCTPGNGGILESMGRHRAVPDLQRISNMKPTTTLERVCYNTAHLQQQMFGGMAFDEVCEYIAGKYGSTPAQVASLIQSFKGTQG